METPLKVAIVIAFTLRMALMIYGLYQDQIMTIKYTDIDYSVFTDASEFMLRVTCICNMYLQYLAQFTHWKIFVFRVNLLTRDPPIDTHQFLHSCFS